MRNCYSCGLLRGGTVRAAACRPLIRRPLRSVALVLSIILVGLSQNAFSQTVSSLRLSSSNVTGGEQIELAPK